MEELSSVDINRIQLDIMDAIDLFCRENHISYFLYYGSLIGAVRHKGYIPWDDDIDIAMLREDYDFFISNFNKMRNDNYRVIYGDDKTNYYYPFAKVIDNNTVWVEKTTKPVDMGVYVDLFPLDKLPKGKKEQKKYLASIKKLINIYNLKIIPVDKKRSLLKNTILIISHIVLLPVKIEKISKRIRDISVRYRNVDSPYVASLSLLVYGNKEIQKSVFFSDVKYLPFEDRRYLVPAQWHEILSRIYGDYMKLPPKEKRITHHQYTHVYKK